MYIALLLDAMLGVVQRGSVLLQRFGLIGDAGKWKTEVNPGTTQGRLTRGRSCCSPEPAICC